MTDEALQIDEVTRLFAESVTVLEQARERLDELAQAEQTASAAAESTADVAERVGEFAKSARDATELLAKAASSTGAAMEAAAGHLDDAALVKLSGAVDGLSAKLDALSGDVDGRLSELADRVEAIDRLEREKQEALDGSTKLELANRRLVVEKEAAEAERDLLKRQLDHIRGNLKERQLSKLERDMPAG